MKTIKINEINKLEGHISFAAALDKGDVKSAKITVEEGARMIEGILIGRIYDEAPIITARICGICPVVHNLTSVKAMEDALEIKVTPAIVSLRKILLAAQIVQSHALHLYFCSLPDFFKMTDNFELLKKFPKEGKKAIIMRDFTNMVVDTIGGRAIHPINSVIGGFNVMPKKDDILALQKEAQEMLKIGLDLMKIFEELKYPEFSRETDYITLYNQSEYGYYDGKLKIRGKETKYTAKDLLNTIKEIESSTVEKRTHQDGKSYMVGALARINNNYSELNPIAKKVFFRNKKKLLSHNTFYNIQAQAIELLHFLETITRESKKALREIEKSPCKVEVKIKKGNGFAISEAPRGILYHNYELDDKGKIKNCNIITPTVQFLNNIEDDLMVFLKNRENFTPEKIKFLIRAYDPCVSCATH